MKEILLILYKALCRQIHTGYFILYNYSWKVIEGNSALHTGWLEPQYCQFSPG